MKDIRISLQETIDILPDAVIVVDQNIKIIAVNEQIYTIFGFTSEELIGQELNLLIPERFRKHHDVHFKNYFRAPTKRHMKSGNDLFGLRKNGEELDIDISLAPIHVQNEQMAIAIIRDITPIKELERSLLKRNEDLSLTNTRLERLGYIIAHDLKSPLLNVHALVGFLIRELSHISTPTISGYTKDLNEILLSMMDLITGVTDYSKIGFQDDSEADVDLNVIAEDVRKLVHFPDGFKFSVRSQLPVIKGNKTKILQVFLNLVNNAVKYIDRPDGRIEIYAQTRENVCFIHVADNGPGVPPELRNKIFDLFRQGTVEKKGSQGIGLAVVKKIIEDHGGKIYIETSDLGGADFVFNWPVFKLPD